MDFFSSIHCQVYILWMMTIVTARLRRCVSLGSLHHGVLVYFSKKIGISLSVLSPSSNTSDCSIYVLDIHVYLASTQEICKHTMY